MEQNITTSWFQQLHKIMEYEPNRTQEHLVVLILDVNQLLETGLNAISSNILLASSPTSPILIAQHEFES